MSKAIKQMQMDSLKKTFAGVRDMVFLSTVGLNAVAENKVRLQLRKKGIRLQQVKNSLARRTFAEAGMNFEKPWQGPTTVAWGANSIKELSKEIEEFKKKHDKVVKIKVAVADGQEVDFAAALKMPTRLEAVGEVIAMILGAGSTIAALLTGPGSQVASQIVTISEKKEEEKKEEGGEKKEEAAAAPAAT
jgi:large subunit ribosomal protein L10